MDSLYSMTLLAALALAVGGAAAGAFAVVRPSARLQRITLGSAFLALAMGVISFAVHLHFGHGPTTLEPMALGRFLRIHPAYGIVVVLSLFAFGAWFLSRARTSSGTI
jgi:ABC-type uncharacterized transport system permease subunit